MRPDITKQHLEFLGEARRAFVHNKNLKTYRNKNNTFIALRRELDPFFDDIEIYEIESFVGKFSRQVDRCES